MASPDGESATAGGVVLVLQQLLGSSHDIATKIFSFFFAARFEQDDLNITHVQKYAHGIPLKTICGGAPFISFLEIRIYTCCKILFQTFLVLTRKGPHQTVHFSLSH
jgi:hypothetical protein